MNNKNTYIVNMINKEDWTNLRHALQILPELSQGTFNESDWENIHHIMMDIMDLIVSVEFKEIFQEKDFLKKCMDGFNEAIKSLKERHEEFTISLGCIEDVFNSILNKRIKEYKGESHELVSVKGHMMLLIDERLSGMDKLNMCGNRHLYFYEARHSDDGKFIAEICKHVSVNFECTLISRVELDDMLLSDGDVCYTGEFYTLKQYMLMPLKVNMASKRFIDIPKSPDNPFWPEDSFFKDFINRFIHDVCIKYKPHGYMHMIERMKSMTGSVFQISAKHMLLLMELINVVENINRTGKCDHEIDIITQLPIIGQKPEYRYLISMSQFNTKVLTKVQSLRGHLNLTNVIDIGLGFQNRIIPGMLDYNKIQRTIGLLLVHCFCEYKELALIGTNLLSNAEFKSIMSRTDDFVLYEL